MSSRFFPDFSSCRILRSMSFKTIAIAKISAKHTAYLNNLVTKQLKSSVRSQIRYF